MSSNFLTRPAHSKVAKVVFYVCADMNQVRLAFQLGLIISRSSNKGVCVDVDRTQMRGRN